jgi:flavin reductase (DIM6/NTAB) family NADH-FMN oxidoreductase RutF
MVHLPNEWEGLLGRMTYGIYVLTCYSGETINGMIASWVSQVSYKPPLILVAVHPHRRSHDLILKGGHFVIHLLSKEQKNMLSRFKGPDPEAKFSSLPWHRGKTGCPVLETCLGYMECTVKESLKPGNHTLIIGEIVDGKLFSGEPEPMCSQDYQGVYLGKY